MIVELADLFGALLEIVYSLYCASKSALIFNEICMKLLEYLQIFHDLAVFTVFEDFEILMDLNRIHIDTCCKKKIKFNSSTFCVKKV